MQVLVDIPKEMFGSIKDGMRHRDDVAYIMNCIENDSIVIPDDARNCDVLSLMMFKELTGDISHLLEIDDYDRQTLEKEWLNAPYNR